MFTKEERLARWSRRKARGEYRTFKRGFVTGNDKYRNHRRNLQTDETTPIAKKMGKSINPR